MVVSGVTDALVEFITAEPLPNLEEGLLRRGRQAVVDGLACMLAGAASRPGSLVRELGARRSCRPEATVVGSDVRLEASQAALANGTAGHALDYDDTQLAATPDRIYGLLTHPTVPVLAASLAVAEVAAASGRRLLQAILVGVEVSCKLAEAMDPDHYRRGFHTTGTVGVFGAAAAAARLLDLRPQEIRHALGIAASLAGGIRANFGTMVKPLHAGRAAQNGLEAAQLAMLGYRADSQALDGRWGFLEVAGGPGGEPARLVGRLGRPWALLDPGVSIKPYPCGSLAQPTMDAFRGLVLEEDLRPELVRSVTVRAGANILEPLRYQQPADALQASFSLPFGLAVLLLRRRAGLAEYRDEVVGLPEVRAVMERVRTVLDPRIDRQGYERMRR